MENKQKIENPSENEKRIKTRKKTRFKKMWGTDQIIKK